MFQKYVHDRAFDQSPTSEAAEPPKEKEQPSPPIGQLNSARAKLAKITASLMGSASEEEANGITVRELEDQLMGVRIKEIDTLAELKEMRQKVGIFEIIRKISHQIGEVDFLNLSLLYAITKQVL